MKKKQAETKTNKTTATSRAPQKETKVAEQEKSFRNWCKIHKKRILLALYYSGAAIVIFSSIYVIMSNVTKTEDVTRDETISFFTEYIDDDTIELGTEEVERDGENGIKKVTYREESYLLSGEVISSLQTDFEITKEPTSKIIRRGTKKWQYMICSDGSWRYYTDEQFKDKNVGFTHASEDDCANNNQGVAVALVDTPPSPDSTATPYSRNGESGLTEDYVRAMEIIAEREQELRNNYIDSTSPTEPFSSSTDYRPFAEWEAKQEAKEQARAAAEKTCQSKAERARKSFRNQLAAMGASGGSEYIYGAQDVYDSEYSNCMQSYGY